jgi:cyclase
MDGLTEIQEIAPLVFLFIGETFRSNATAFVRGGDVLLIDGLASREDARRLERVLTNDWKKTVRWIVSTHYFSDHMAAFGLFPDAPVLAHKNALHTFWSEDFRSSEEARHFVEPSVLVGEGLSIVWDRYTLEIFYNPGHTMCALNVDVPEADLLFAGDAAVGNIAYFHYAPPRLVDAALARALSRGRSRVVLGHGGPLPARTLANARIYLERLGRKVHDARSGADAASTISKISLDECLADGLEGSDFERFFHERNLVSIASRNLFTDAS